MKDSWIDAKGERMLELLSEGSPSRVIAKQMGYQEGTMRVYLHKLYKRIGVANKTEAVIWYLGRGKQLAARPPEPARAIRPSGSDDLIGEMAIQEDLYAALGVMSEFLGPYGRVWEIAARLNGEETDARALEQRDRSRMLWRALLRADASYGKGMYDADQGARLLLDAPLDAVLLVALLTIGGYSGAADNLLGRLSQKRRGTPGASAREIALVRSLRSAIDHGDTAAYSSLYKAAVERSSSAGFKQIAMVLLFHAYRLRKDLVRARQTANALWAEAESARRELEAMGDRPLGQDSPVPLPDKLAAKPIAANEKVAVTR
jgi:DNA-binding CsgD family transcriptional regulator